LPIGEAGPPQTPQIAFPVLNAARHGEEGLSAFAQEAKQPLLIPPHLVPLFAPYSGGLTQVRGYRSLKQAMHHASSGIPDLAVAKNVVMAR